MVVLLSLADYPLQEVPDLRLVAIDKADRLQRDQVDLRVLQQPQRLVQIATAQDLLLILLQVQRQDRELRLQLAALQVEEVSRRVERDARAILSDGRQ